MGSKGQSSHGGWVVRWREWRLRHACRRVAPLLRSFVEGELAPREAGAVRRHLSRCRECAARAESFSTVISTARSLPVPKMPADFAERLRARLALEPVPQPSLWQRAARRAPGGGRAFPLGPSAAAALSLALAGVLLAPAPQLTAQEVATRVQQSWARIQDYHCVFHSTIRYRGRRMESTREQWFSRPDRFRIESDEGQRWTMLIAGPEVVTYLPDAQVVIQRPRRLDEPDLPFPFRSTADMQGDITIDALLSQLRETRDAELLGREEVLGKSCYVLKYRMLKPPTRRVRHPRAFDCRVWIDGDTFLPLKAKMYYDARTWSYTHATGLEVNRGLDPESFRLRVPDGARWVRGDVDPRLFEGEGAAVLKCRLDPERAIAALQPRASFAVLSPSWVPAGYHLIAARARHERLGSRIERVVTLVLADDDGDAITVVQEPAPEERTAVSESLGRDTGDWPYPYVRLTGMRAGTWVRLMAANLSEEEAVRVFRGMRTEAELQRTSAAQAKAGGPDASPSASASSGS